MLPRIAAHAVVPAVTRLAPSAALKPAGLSTIAGSSTTMYSCSVPSLLMPPQTLAKERLRMSPVSQLLSWRRTLAPVLLDQEELGPVEWMMPAPSEPGIRSSLWSPGSVVKSVW
jgi:hypothetical protein